MTDRRFLPIESERIDNASTGSPQSSSASQRVAEASSTAQKAIERRRNEVRKITNHRALQSVISSHLEVGEDTVLIGQSTVRRLSSGSGRFRRILDGGQCSPGARGDERRRARRGAE